MWKKKNILNKNHYGFDSSYYCKTVILFLQLLPPLIIFFAFFFVAVLYIYWRKNKWRSAGKLLFLLLTWQVMHFWVLLAYMNGGIFCFFCLRAYMNDVSEFWYILFSFFFPICLNGIFTDIFFFMELKWYAATNLDLIPPTPM